MCFGPDTVIESESHQSVAALSAIVLIITLQYDFHTRISVYLHQGVFPLA